MAANGLSSRPDVSLAYRGHFRGWSYNFQQRMARLDHLNSSAIVDPEFDEDANDDPLTGEVLDHTLYNTGR